MANATNPKRRSGGKSTKTKESEVTDTATEPTEASDQTVEAAESTAEVAEAVEAATEDSGKLSAQSEIAPEDALYEAITKFASDKDVNALQEVYRSVHTSSRGKAQGVAMKRAMTEGNVEMDVLMEVLDAFNNLPTATKTTRTRPALDEGTQHIIQLAGMMVGFEMLRAELGENAFAAANAWYTGPDGAPEEHRNTILRVAEATSKASSKGIRSRGGNRVSMKEKLSDLVSRGDLTVGQVLKGANDVTATVTAEGKLSTVDPKDGETKEFDSPSAAARVHRVKEDGKPTSTNGWDFWVTEDGKKVGDLRQS